MEGVGARLGRSSSRYGTTTVFTGPVRRWKKRWIHITPSSTDNTNNNNHKHHPSSNGNNNDAASHILLYKWTPIRKTHNHQNNNNNTNTNTNDDDNSADEEPPRRKMKYIPIAVLEEQNNEAQTDEAKAIENDPIAPEAEPSSKPDMNDVPMEENQVSERIHADDNKSTVGLSLNLNARDDGDSDGDEEQPNDDDADEVVE